MSALPLHGDWSDVPLDVHALMSYFFPIDAGFVPSGYLMEVASSLDLVASYATLPALYQSVLRRTFENDPAVLALRGKVLHSINASLRKVDSQTSDATLISIQHQLYYDCYVASKATILAHLDGLYRIVNIRGGLHRLGLRGDLAHMVKVYTLMGYVTMEYRPPNDYLQFKTRCSAPVEVLAPVSLEYCPIMPPRSLFHIVRAPSEELSGMLHPLIDVLQRLTNTFLHGDNSLEEEEEQQIRCYLQVVNSPGIPQTSSESPLAWIYESCRLAGIIFATAIRYRIPLSRAVSKAHPDSGGISLLDDLCQVVFRSPYSSQPFWGPLAGCFLWVSLVCASLSYCAVHVDSPEDGRYWSTKSRRASLIVPFSFATKLFHAEASSAQAFHITKIMVLIQEKLALGC